MAFARSNSLSLNTGATNNMFSAQNNSQPQAGGLFGNTNNNSGGLFGSSTNNASQPAGGLFGSNTTTQPSGGLFGSSTNNQAQPAGGLFGASTNQQAQPSGGLFGQNNNNASTGLFGSSTTNQATTTQPQGGLFGGNNASNTQTGGLFGAGAQSQSQSQPQVGGSLFGATTGIQSQGLGGSLFGNSAQQSQQNRGGLFGGLGASQQPSLGATANQPRQPTLLGTSIFNGNSTTNSNAPLAGSLTMGQGQTQQQTVPGTKIDLSNIRPTTRFADLHDDLKKTLENIDSFIKQQESYAAQCEALLPAHGDNVASLAPDVELINGKVDTVELSLENDSRNIHTAKSLVRDDVRDLARCIRVLENQQLPTQFHYGQSANSVRSLTGDGEYDTDLVGYFKRQAEAMSKTLATFTSNLAEIEGHLHVVETDTMEQSARVSAQRAGGRAAGVQPHDAVRELADTLRGFEGGILQAAGSVGACREGFNELVLGKERDAERRHVRQY